MVIVQDNGIGFDTSCLHHDGKTHIGIQNVKNRLMAQCGGTLTIESEIGVGTSAVIAIPKGNELQ